MRTRTPIILLEADNAVELKEKLAAIDVNVPLRSERRTPEHVEIYAIAYLMATLSPDYWKFPLKVIHRDRPDFLVSTRRRDIGIEHVEVVPTNEAWMAQLREEGYGPDMHFIRHALIDEPVL